jgi:hypothetical protein
MAQDVRVVIDQAALRQLVQHLRTSCFPGAQLLERELKQTLLDSHPAGRIYTQIYRMVNGKPVPVGKRSTPHQASAPGQAPAIDSGDLYDSIIAERVSGGYGNRTGARVRIKQRYWEFLELGTRNMAPRPWVKPTIQRIIKAGILLRTIGNEAKKRVK